MNLRDYQQKAVDDVLAAFQTHNRVMLQMPTGTGKTEVFCEIIRRFANRKLVLVHRRELVYQIQNRLKSRCGVQASIILAGHQNDFNAFQQVQIANIPTLIRRDESYYPKNVSLIVIDEAHHAKATSYQNIINHYRNQSVKVLGVTATPCRLSGESFSDIFTTLITTCSIKQFIEKKYLAGFRHWATSSPDLSQVKLNRQKNDYDEHDLAIVMSEDKIMSDLVESYKKYGESKQSVIFAVNKDHSEKIVERFNREGYTAKSITCDSPIEQRIQIIEQYKKGEIKIISNVGVFTEGFDCPSISVVQLARPTKSLTLYLQMVGRALRPKSDHSNAIILDNAKLWKTHGLITKNHTWTLNGVTKDKRSTTIENRNHEVIESTDQILHEIKGLEMEEVSENIQTKQPVKIQLISDYAIIHEENFTIWEFPDRYKKILQKLSELKKRFLFDQIFIQTKGITLHFKVNHKQKTSEWVKAKFRYNLIQDSQIKHCTYLPHDALPNNDEKVVSLSHFFTSLFYSFYGKFIYLEMHEEDSSLLFKGVDRKKKFYLILKSDYFNIDCSQLDIEFPYKKLKQLCASNMYVKDSWKIFVNKVQPLGSLYNEIKSWLDILK